MIQSKLRTILGSLRASYRRRGLPAVLVNSIPKSGTNLLKNVITAIPNMAVREDVSMASQRHDPADRLEYIRGIIKKISPGCIYTGHIPYTEEIHSWIGKEGFRHIFLYRDPRDVTVSLYHYIMKERIPHHPYYEMYSGFGSDHERLMKCITGYGDGVREYRNSADAIPSIRLSYKVYEPWLRAPGVLAIKYEDLIGPGRMQTIENILKFIGIPCQPELLGKINAEGFEPKKSHTYRKGASGGWRDEYTPEHIEAFRKILSDEYLALWGYTWDN
jgi:sulfotransferase 6B1